MGKTFKILAVLIIALLAGFAYWQIRDFRRNEKPINYNLPTAIGNGEQFGITGLYGEEEYKLASETGAKWIRPQFSWENLQKQGQPIDFKKLDELYAQSEKYGFKIMISLRTGHQQPWPTKCDLKLCENKDQCPHDFSSCPPVDDNEYRDFVYELAKHFKGKIDHFIIENEVNTLTFWNGTAEDYLKLRKSAHEGIHRANPEAVVLDSGIASEAWMEAIAREKYCKEGKDPAKNFIIKAAERRYSNINVIVEQVLGYFKCEANGQPVLDRGSEITNAIFAQPESFDALSIHYYESYELLPELISWAKNKMSSLGYSKPIYLTEGGYYDSQMSQKGKAALNLVAKDLVKLHVFAFAEGAKQFIWLPAVAKDTEGIPKPYQGLYDKNKKILPAGRAYKILISKIGGFSKVSKINISSVLAYEFVVNEKKVLIVWADEPKEVKFSDLPFSPRKATGFLGEEIDLSKGTLNVSDAPLYLE